VLTSTDPFEGPSSWHPASIDRVGASLSAISCASPTLCVAVDRSGEIFSSTSPAAGASAWHVVSVDEGRPLAVVSCPTATLCVVLDEQGNSLVSSDPSGGPRSWVPSGNSGSVLPQSLSCPSQDRCLAIGRTSDVSDDLLGGTEAWLPTPVGEGGGVVSVSCPLVTFCTAVDFAGHATVGTASPPSGTLAVSVLGTGQGSVNAVALSCASSCSRTYARGTPLTLTATPASGSTFAGWGGPCSGVGTCTLSVGRSTGVTATFALVPPPPGFALTVSVGGLGTVTGPGIACPPKCRTALAVGQVAALAARPAAGWRFAGWSGACTGAGRCTVRGDESLSLSALFERGGAVRVRIRRVSVDARRHRVKITFTAPPGRALCALRRKPTFGPTHFHPCRSPRTYVRLRRGRYEFYVRAAPAGSVSATRSFTLP